VTQARPRDMPLRRGLSRLEAATYIGVGITKFDEMIKDGRMPKPFKIDDRVLWDIRLLDEAVDHLVEASRNEWDDVA
jgi:predicted DNA-binding transcriptional regulator AlpA